ncbi:MAG: hypothetical protein AUH08_11595 [Verrucomicrobia bacterium 13_2_20CM_54_12]|nr:MAG: hypothetical protein AUH08_11595 [Verrucomicrobia bacterium 13_2_20CM_54_12]OLE13635.1 MAG: hypothetical protein AUG52_00135 [Verrucomicrobia bacterium 13_1_20CM_3_54_17]
MLETVPTLEFHEGAPALVAINESSVDQMRDSFLLADRRCLSDQCVLGSLVIMLVHRDDVKNRRQVVNVNHFQETYKFPI